MKWLLCLVLTCILTMTVKAQVSFEPITIGERGWLHKKYYERCDIEMTPIQLFKLFQKDINMSAYEKPLAWSLLGSTLLNATGQIFVLWPITEEIAHNPNPNWYLAAIGAGCIALALPLRKKSERVAERAINYYNSGY